MRLTVTKEVGANWIVSMYDYFQDKPEICRNGFRKAGLTEVIANPESIATSELCDSDNLFNRSSSSDSIIYYSNS